MRVECESCHELVAASFAIEGRRITATCEKCATKMTIESTSRRATTPAMGIAICCPKCDRPRGNNEVACPGCGLATERMANYAATRDATTPPEVLAAWERVAASWDDTAAHDALFNRVTATGNYAWAAARYRDAARSKPQEDATSQRALERLRRAAEVTLFASKTRTDDEKTPYRGPIAVLVVFVIALAGLLLYQLVRGGQQPAPDDPPGAQVR
jgi:hypothetical protein